MQVATSISKEMIQKVFQDTLDSQSFFDDLGDVVLGVFTGVRLIGEIECQEGKETYEELRTCLNQVVVRKSRHLAAFDPSTKQLRAVFSLYFVWTGIFAYGEESGHDLWPPILRGIGIEPHQNLTGRCGELFMQCLQENGLEEFRSLRTGHPYVTRILLHGLIPDIHIERFINDIIKPELWSPVGSYNNGNRVIDKWCHEKRLRYLPTPIKDFIEHGRPINADVIDRFLDMAKRWEEEDAPDLWPLRGLPKYMVDAFRRFRGGFTGSVSSRRQGRFQTGAQAYLSIDLEKRVVSLIFLDGYPLKAGQLGVGQVR